MNNIPFATIVVLVIICLFPTGDDVYRGMAEAKYTGRACGNGVKYPKGDCKDNACYQACMKNFGVQFGHMQGFCESPSSCICWWPCRRRRRLQSHLID